MVVNMSIAKNQKKIKKSKEKQISVINQIIEVISLEEKDILFKFLVDFLFELKYYQSLSEINSYHTCKLIDLLSIGPPNSFYLNLR